MEYNVSALIYYGTWVREVTKVFSFESGLFSKVTEFSKVTIEFENEKIISLVSGVLYLVLVSDTRSILPKLLPPIKLGGSGHHTKIEKKLRR